MEGCTILHLKPWYLKKSLSFRSYFSCFLKLIKNKIKKLSKISLQQYRFGHIDMRSWYPWPLTLTCQNCIMSCLQLSFSCLTKIYVFIDIWEYSVNVYSWKLLSCKVTFCILCSHFHAMFICSIYRNRKKNVPVNIVITYCIFVLLIYLNLPLIFE